MVNVENCVEQQTEQTSIVDPPSDHDPDGQASDSDDQNFSDPDDFVDEGLENENTLVEMRKHKPTLNCEFNDVLIVDNVPQVGEDRLDKLKAAMSKIFAKFGKVVNEFYPMDKESGKTTGYIMIQFDNELSAMNAREPRVDDLNC